MRRIPCSFYNACGNMIDPHEPGIFIEVSGWHQLRSMGGQNAVIRRHETGRVACALCGDKIRNGEDPMQGEAFPT